MSRPSIMRKIGGWLSKLSTRKEFQYTQIPAPLLPDLAKLMHEQFLQDQRLFQRQLLDMSKWLTVTLMVLNSGGALSILHDSSLIPHPARSGTFFILGIVFALASGWFNQLGTALMLPINFGYAGYWARVMASGQQEEDTERELDSRLRRLRKWRFVTPLMGWISFFAFVGGAAELLLNAPF